MDQRFFLEMISMIKEFKTIDEQIEILKSRGLVFDDEEFAKEKLLETNYYNTING